MKGNGLSGGLLRLLCESSCNNDVLVLTISSVQIGVQPMGSGVMKRLLFGYIVVLVLIVSVSCAVKKTAENAPQAAAPVQEQAPAASAPATSSQVSSAEHKKHTFELIESKPSTTTEEGYEKYRCTVCGYEETDWLDLVSPVRWAGIRVSSYGIRGSFGEDNFPTPQEMASYSGKVASCYEGSTGACILIVGTVSERTWDCRLAFPLSHEIDRVTGREDDFYEAYLDAYDKAGYDVWLQVEPGEADLVDLAKEVLNRYKHHKSVKGFGIDVEWHKTAGTNGYGVKLTDEEAARVLAAVREVNPEYTLFVKHWDSGWLPDAADGLIFVNDSQQFRSLDQMKDEFSGWAFLYEPCPVMVQIGYDADRRVWGKMENPILELGTALQNECTYGNDLGIIWVDFTLKEAIGKIN